MNDDLTYRIAKLEAKPGDVLVFTTKKPITMEAATRIRADITRLIPHLRVLICDGGAEVSLLTAAELRERLDCQGDDTLETTS